MKSTVSSTGKTVTVRRIRRSRRPGKVTRLVPAKGLPLARTQPVTLEDVAAPRMSVSERVYLQALLDGAPAYYLLGTESRIDVGHWLSNARVWALAGRQALTLAATGKRPFFESIPYAHLRESLYNHLTGELVFAPRSRKGAALSALKISPLEALQLLAQIHANPKEDLNHA